MNRKAVMKRVLFYIQQDKKLVVASFICAFISVITTLYLPICIGEAIDYAIGTGNVDFNAIIQVLIRMAAVLLINVGVTWLMNRINNKLTYHVSYRIRKDAVEHISKCPISYIDSHDQGDLLSRILNDVEILCDGLLMGFTQFFTGVLSIFITLFIMLQIDMRMGILVLLITPLSLVMAAFISKKTHLLFLIQSKNRGSISAFINERISHHKVSVAYEHQQENIEEFNAMSEELKESSMKAIFYSSLTNPCTRFVNAIVYASVALMGSLIVIGGSMSVGQLTIYLNYANQYTKPFNEITSVISELQNALACAQRVFEFIDSPVEKLDAPDAFDLENVKGKVELRHVSFSYNKNKPLISDFNLVVQPGQRIAIVGPTGCGKTTLINLLMRFYEIDEGDILLDDINYRDITVKSLRNHFGMVLQDTWIKNATIRDNITLHKHISDEKLIEASRKTKAHSFIQRLPQGYDTMLGDISSNLSIGQKQLLCITRVMVQDPKILILDEATSNIDTLTELQVQHAFQELMKNKTSFIVAHRLSTIQNADCILVMKDGKIIEKGTHESLLKQKGFYATLYHSQFLNQMS